MTKPRWRSCVLGLLVLAVALSGCATLPQQLGVRPTEPPIDTSADACKEFGAYSTYAQGLQEAYHSRASQNRGWLYAAGILALGVAAASGGLAVAATVGVGTLGLLAISGGFAAGTFAVVSNNALALSYTVAANSIDQTLKSARAQLAFVDPTDTNKGYTSASCAVALTALIAGVSEARTHLEVARTDNAAGAIARAKDQLKLLNEQVAVVASADITHVTLAAAIVDVAPLAPKSAQPPAGTSVTITVKNINLSQVGLDEVKVAFGTKELAADAIGRPDVANNPTTYTVTFTHRTSRSTRREPKEVPAGLGPSGQNACARQGRQGIRVSVRKSRRSKRRQHCPPLPSRALSVRGLLSSKE